jgi:hypothetical protein
MVSSGQFGALSSFLIPGNDARYVPMVGTGSRFDKLYFNPLKRMRASGQGET